MRINRIIFTFILLFAASQVKSQYVWHVSEADNDWRYQNGFQALNCDGDDCTAAGTTYDFLYNYEGMVFWHSTDGGISWVVQDPHFPFYNFSNTQHTPNYFNQVQQIDNRNAVAIGRFGVIFRTTDAGETWVQQQSDSQSNIQSIHFFNPMIGIYTCSNSDHPVYTTSDGGNTWTPVSFDDTLLVKFAFQSGLRQCHAFGNGKFSIFQPGLGPIWTTKDNWVTIQASSIYIDSTDPEIAKYGFSDCRFAGDTIIVFGDYIDTVTLGAIARSTNGGKSWEKPYRTSTDSLVKFSALSKNVQAMSEISNDTIFAATGNVTRLLLSTDGGRTWSENDFRVDTNYNYYGVSSLTRTKNGPLIILQTGSIIISIIAKGAQSKLSVGNASNDQNFFIYPNPAQTMVIIHTKLYSDDIVILDILGRVIRAYRSNGADEIRLDLRGISAGMYYLRQGLSVIKLIIRE